MFHPGAPGGERIADGGQHVLLIEKLAALVELFPGGFDALQAVKQGVVIQGEWSPAGGKPAEGDEADQVARPLLNELSESVLDHIEPGPLFVAGGKVERLHGA